MKRYSKGNKYLWVSFLLTVCQSVHLLTTKVHLLFSFCLNSIFNKYFNEKGIVGYTTRYNTILLMIMNKGS